MTDNILSKILANKQVEVQQQKSLTSLDRVAKLAGNIHMRASFKQAIVRSTTGIIAEFKRRSPSRDWLFKGALAEEIIPQYSHGGACAISVLTDYDFFGGTLADLELGASLTKTPLLRKDFIVDEYQIYQAKASGGSAVLLIASALTTNETKQFAAKAKELGLDVLLEIHNEWELDHLNEYIDVVGVNNRNLSTFETDVRTSFDLINKIPSDFVRISESGISDPRTVKDLRQAGYKGFLMGENFMKTDNPGKALLDFVRALM